MISRDLELLKLWCSWLRGRWRETAISILLFQNVKHFVKKVSDFAFLGSTEIVRKCTLPTLANFCRQGQPAKQRASSDRSQNSPPCTCIRVQSRLVDQTARLYLRCKIDQCQEEIPPQHTVWVLSEWKEKIASSSLFLPNCKQVI